jgi:hypothetical protein
MVPKIDIWRAASLMLKRYGANAEIESAIRLYELAAEGDLDGRGLAPHHARRRRACKHGAVRPGGLTARRRCLRPFRLTRNR